MRPDPAMAAVLDRLRVIPDTERAFTVPAEEAWLTYQVGAELLDVLRCEGMPARWYPDGWRYDMADLVNVALHLDIGSRHRRVLVWWVRELERPYGDTVRYRLDYLPRCPAPDHPGPCRYSVLRPDGQRVESSVAADHRGPLHSLAFRLNRRWPALPAPLRRLADEVAGIKFVRLHDPLRWDTEFIRATGIGDCSGVAALMVEEATRYGVPARMSFGRSLTPPFAAGHFWAEFLVGQHWVPLDPLLIGAMLDWGVCAPSRWTRYDSFGGILARFGEHRVPFAFHDGLEIEARLSSRWLPDSPEQPPVPTNHLGEGP